MGELSENVIQGQCDPIKGSVALCYNIEHLQSKNRTGEQLVDSAKTKTKTVTGTLHGKVSEQLELSVAFEGICPVY